MMTNYRTKGFTLLELVVTIVVLSIAVTGLVLSYTQTLFSAANPGLELQAAVLADARMNLIGFQRWVNGYSAILDPCDQGSPPAACTALSNFASSAGLSVASNISVGSGVTTATVTVSGRASYSEQLEFFS